ncbi:hypothetical protein KEM52_001385 [Ascosphaera acerosa]|nr:hypothetical protein KEM52_001385 [Ascosphaera acerosa]
MKESQALLQPLPTISVTVGYSRLYTVRFPSLILHPVYWAPIGDVAPVIRGTWFYKSTMLPVEPEVANRLERGYCYMRPWTGTWQDELNSCVEHGAEAEEKIVWKLFQQEQEEQGGDTAPRNTQDDAEQFEKGAHDGANHALQFDQTEAAGPHGKARDALRPTSVIYVNATDAQILRPSLLPSAHRGRRPLSAIRKGHEIGIAVVRGFDYKRWSKLHPPRTKTAAAGKLMEMYSRGRASGQVIAQPRCPGCLMEERKPRPTELVLVIHGIGQKLSERVESFNFTHHINGFRRQVNIEMSETSIWPSMRDGMGGLMVLPVNWRAILSREDDDVHALTHDDPNGNQFTLKDITPETVPYVRNMISDVMLDIPYYLSNHKPKMIAAVAKEANRVYRLWCANNPGFQEYGRVHIIAHSLGSVMAVDILSRQPTALLPRPADVTATSLADRSSDQLFNFDTKNLFLCGSPVGFFLLLNKATLSPRQGRTKPGLREGDMESGLCGERGQYGCLAVDNVYNIMHDTDPISYCLNAAVDRRLAAVLKPAFLPSLQTSWMQSLSHVLTFSSSTPLGGSQSANGSSTVAEHVTLSKSAAAPLSRHLPPTSPSGVRSFTPATPLHPLCSPVSAMSFDADQDNPADPDTENPLTQLPSNVELETHDFTREEIAEKRMYALNDNGQIDYHMSGNAGPLSIQYLNMLSAHTSYWSSQDFTRLVVMEVGREPGRKHAIAALKARKKKGWQGGKNEAK